MVRSRLSFCYVATSAMTGRSDANLGAPQQQAFRHVAVDNTYACPAVERFPLPDRSRNPQAVLDRSRDRRTMAMLATSRTAQGGATWAVLFKTVLPLDQRARTSVVSLNEECFLDYLRPGPITRGGWFAAGRHRWGRTYGRRGPERRIQRRGRVICGRIRCV